LAGAGNAHKIIATAIAKIPQANAEQLRQVEAERLEARINNALVIMEGEDDARVKLAAIGELRQLSESLRKLLGLDAASKFEFAASVAERSPEDIVAWYRKSGKPFESWPARVQELAQAIEAGAVQALPPGGG
jgi:hypothetical protein